MRASYLSGAPGVAVSASYCGRSRGRCVTEGSRVGIPRGRSVYPRAGRTAGELAKTLGQSGSHTKERPETIDLGAKP